MQKQEHHQQQHYLINDKVKPADNKMNSILQFVDFPWIFMISVKVEKYNTESEILNWISNKKLQHLGCLYSSIISNLQIIWLKEQN